MLDSAELWSNFISFPIFFICISKGEFKILFIKITCLWACWYELVLSGLFSGMAIIAVRHLPIRMYSSSTRGAISCHKISKRSARQYTCLARIALPSISKRYRAHTIKKNNTQTLHPEKGNMLGMHKI